MSSFFTPSFYEVNGSTPTTTQGVSNFNLVNVDSPNITPSASSNYIIAGKNSFSKTQYVNLNGGGIEICYAANGGWKVSSNSGTGYTIKGTCSLAGTVWVTPSTSATGDSLMSTSYIYGQYVSDPPMTGTTWNNAGGNYDLVSVFGNNQTNGPPLRLQLQTTTAAASGITGSLTSAVTVTFTWQEAA